MSIYILLLLACILLTGLAQVLLKMGSTGNRSGSIYLNKYSISGYAIFLLITVLSVITLREIELKSYYAFNSFNYVVVLILSFLLLNERITWRKIAGTIIIILGVLVFNLSF